MSRSSRGKKSSPNHGEGFQIALRRPSIPKGSAVDFGFGACANLIPLARKFPGKTVGYELDNHFLKEGIKILRENKLNARLVIKDALNVNISDESLSAMSIGITLYLPKSMVYNLLKSSWKAVKKNGIFHVGFATPMDGTLKDDFVTYTCLPYPETGYVLLYSHYCGFNCAIDHPGVRGASYWEPNEAKGAVIRLGLSDLVYEKTFNWTQVLRFYNSDTKTEDIKRLKRSFYRITLQKL